MEPMNFSPISAGNSPTTLSGNAVIWPPPAPAYLPPFLAGELSSSSPSKSYSHGARLFDAKGHQQSNGMNLGGKSLGGRHVGFDDLRKEESPKGPPKFGFGSISSPPETSMSFAQSPPPGIFESTPKRPAESFSIYGGGEGGDGRSREQNSGHWVTVFGFPANATSFILSHFATYGNICETKNYPGCNWISLRYDSKMEARRALGKNGSILGNSLMVGVIAMKSPELNGFMSEPSSSSFVRSPGESQVFASPAHAGLSQSYCSPSHSTPSVSKADEIKSRLRPLNSSTIGMGGLGDRHVTMANVPRENTSMITKAFELFFGY